MFPDLKIKQIRTKEVKSKQTPCLNFKFKNVPSAHRLVSITSGVTGDFCEQLHNKVLLTSSIGADKAEDSTAKMFPYQARNRESTEITVINGADTIGLLH